MEPKGPVAETAALVLLISSKTVAPAEKPVMPAVALKLRVAPMPADVMTAMPRALVMLIGAAVWPLLKAAMLTLARETTKVFAPSESVVCSKAKSPARVVVAIVRLAEVVTTRTKVPAGRSRVVVTLLTVTDSWTAVGEVLNSRVKVEFAMVTPGTLERAAVTLILAAVPVGVMRKAPEPPERVRKVVEPLPRVAPRLATPARMIVSPSTEVVRVKVKSAVMLIRPASWAVTPLALKAK